jgi:hypothetical protein
MWEMSTIYALHSPKVLNQNLLKLDRLDYTAALVTKLTPCPLKETSSFLRSLFVPLIDLNWFCSLKDQKEKDTLFVLYVTHTRLLKMFQLEWAVTNVLKMTVFNP